MMPAHHVSPFRPIPAISSSATSRTTPRQLQKLALAATALLVLARSPSARADEFEARWSARPLVGAARVAEPGTTDDATALAAGGALSLAYGLSNRLDVGAELVAVTTMPTFDGQIESNGFIATGDYRRRSASALLLFGPTWRFGPGWSPVVSLGAGGGVRHRTDGTFLRTGLIPDDRRTDQQLDLGFSARVGLERRLSRRITLGAYGTVLTAWSPDLPPLAIAALSVGLSYVYYPNLAP